MKYKLTYLIFYVFINNFYFINKIIAINLLTR